MKILVPVQDQSIYADLVVFLRQHRFVDPVEVLVLHVIEAPPYGYYADIDVHKHVVSGAQTMINSLIEDLQKALPAMHFEGSVVEGDAKEEILKAAHSMPSQLVIMGTHGRGALGRFFLGSVSLAVHAALPCSLLILRSEKGAAKSAVRWDVERQAAGI